MKQYWENINVIFEDTRNSQTNYIREELDNACSKLLVQGYSAKMINACVLTFAAKLQILNSPLDAKNLYNTLRTEANLNQNKQSILKQKNS